MNRISNSKYILIQELDVKDNKLSVKFLCSKDIKKYFLTDYLYVEYSQDIENVDKSILNIPIVSNIITMAWAVGADIYLDTLDSTFLNSLGTIKAVFEEWYPQFSFSTNIYLNKVVSNRFNGEGYGLLFSGGVDSITSFIRHRDKDPDLFTIWGADIPVTETKFWEKTKDLINLFADQGGVKVNFIKTNMQHLLNQDLLASKFNIVGWWGAVSHGIMLLSLIAPLTTDRIGTVLIAATRTENNNMPWGSHLSIDNNIAWADVNVVHDGYKLSRQEKVRHIAKSPEYLSYLRVCYSSCSDYNCSHCEKCLRTITALTLEGIDPKSCNFNIDGNSFHYIKDCFIKGKFTGEAGMISMWADIQTHIPENFDAGLDGGKEFFRWFKEFDLSKYRMNKFRHFLWIISCSIEGIGVIKTTKKALFYILVLKLRCTWLPMYSSGDPLLNLNEDGGASTIKKNNLNY